MLDTKFQNMPTLTDWATYSRRKLFHHVLSWATVEKIARVAQFKSNKHILEQFLCAEGVLQVQPDETDICDKLTAEGILSRLGTSDKYEMSSKFIWTIVLNAYAVYPSNTQIESMFFKNGDVDTKKLIECCLCNFDAEFVKRAAVHSTKKLEMVTSLLSSNDNVPSENAYHVQMLMRIRLLLPASWHVESEADVVNKKCDLVLSPLNTTRDKKQRIAIEIVAHARDEESIREHYSRVATKYTTVKNVKEVWVISFDTNETCFWPHNAKQDNNIMAAHVFHDILWNKVLLTFHGDNTSIPINKLI